MNAIIEKINRALSEASAQAAVRAVVLTLCSIEPVERVQLQLLGGAGLQYCAIDASIAPDSAWLE